VYRLFTVERHLPYGISPSIAVTSTYLHATAARYRWTRPALTPADRPVLDLPTPKGRKAELIDLVKLAASNTDRRRRERAGRRRWWHEERDWRRSNAAVCTTTEHGTLKHV